MVIQETIKVKSSTITRFLSVIPSILLLVAVVTQISLSVCFMKPIDKVIQIGYLFFTESNSQAGRVYDAKGLSPTIVCNGGGHKQPKVIVTYETD